MSGLIFGFFCLTARAPEGGTVKLRFVNGQQYEVPLTLPGGKKAWFLLDTGSYRSFVTEKGAARLRSAGASVEADGSLSLEGASIGNLPVGKIDLAPFPSTLNTPVGKLTDTGILGLDFFKRFRMGLDLEALTMRLWPLGTPAEPDLREWFTTVPAPIRFWKDEHDLYQVFVDVSNVSVPMVLDVGSPATFVVPTAMPNMIGAKRIGSGKAVFSDATRKTEVYEAGPVGIGEAWLKGRRSVVASELPAGEAGLLGSDLLKRFRVLLDFEREVAYFLSRAPSVAEDRPVLKGPLVALESGIVFRWPFGERVVVPPGAAYSYPEGYSAQKNADGSVTLVPPSQPATQPS